MKKNLLLLLAVPALAGFTSCSSDDEKGFAPSAANEIRVTTEVMDLSRAGHTTDNLGEFGLIIGSDAPDFSYHKQMVRNGSEWATSDAKAMYWEDQAKAVSVIAYAPYRADDINSRSKIEIDVQADQSTEDAVKASDFIAMKNGAFVPQNDLTADGKLAVRMGHMMSKVFVNVQYPEFYDQAEQANPMSTFTVDGLKVNATLDFDTWDGTRESGSLAIDGNSAAETMTPLATSFDAAARTVSYEFIAVPQTANIEVKFVIAGIPYSWKYTDLELKSGYATTLNLNIDKQGVSMDNDVTVDPWDDGSSITGKPEQGAEPYTIKEITDKSAWSIAYGFCSMPFGPYAQMMDGDTNPDTGVFTYILDNYNNSPMLGNPFTVVDFGSKKWMAGVGIAVSYHDVLPNKVEFYVTDGENLGDVITADQRKLIMAEGDLQGDDLAKSDEFKTLYESMKTADATYNWTKVGEITIEAMTAEAGRRSYWVDFDEDALAANHSTRYVKMVITPFAPGLFNPQGDRVKICEFMVKAVTAHNGVPVE